MSTPQEPDREEIIEALARLHALSLNCSRLADRLRELDREALAIATQLRIATFGDAPEDDHGYETDPINVAVWTRSEELRSKTGKEVQHHA